MQILTDATGGMCRSSAPRDSGTVAAVALDLTDREVIRLRCNQCDREYDRIVVFVKEGEDAYAVASAACHGHPNGEVWIDATFGSWVEPFADHITMSCRVSSTGCSAVDALVASKGDANYYGTRMARAETLRDARLPDLWNLVDALVLAVPEIGAALDS